MRRLIPCLLATLVLAACQPNGDTAAPAGDAPAPAAANESRHAFQDAISAEDFAAHVERLASDEFEGRGPGTTGEQKTVEYLKAQMERIGLQPGNDGEWYQTVPMVETIADDSTVLHLTVDGKPRELAFGEDMVIGTRTGQQQVEIADSELVFVGYGVDAPEQKWNDYAGVDVKGKTVVMLVNDPGFHADDAALFEGKRMTYYGRWTYKFEEAARKGAAAALVIHDTPGASYGWDVVRNSWSGTQYDLPASVDPAPRLPAQGWISGEAAKSLFADAGLDLDQLRAAANKRGFKAVPLDATMSLDLASTISETSSRNVVGMLPGSARPDEAVLYMAHWDHLGKHDVDPAQPEADVIYNGAVDNATGVAGVLEIAEAFASQDRKPERSLVFLAVTLEESGLLGSQYYVANPVVPLEKTVAVFNIDAMSVYGRSRDYTVVGMGSSELEDLLKKVADGQGRTLHQEAHPEAGGYFRSDHFNFAKAGVPALYVDGGDDLVDGGKAAGDAAARAYNEQRYHSPADEFDAASWKLGGTVEDLVALYTIGSELADSQQWPNWYEGNPFKATRDLARSGASAAQ